MKDKVYMTSLSVYQMVDSVLLGVNVDHVATIRQARRTIYPDPLEVAQAALRGGADQVTIHLREDRRHIQDKDLENIRTKIDAPLNLEMAAVPEIINIACRIRPNTTTLVPERREELTTEGGLDVVGEEYALCNVIDKLKSAGIVVSLFIDPEPKQIEASLRVGADAVELHTGAFCDGGNEAQLKIEKERLVRAMCAARGTRLKLCAGHGINYSNATAILNFLPDVVEYNIGHSIVARAILVGMERAVREMKALLVT